MKDEEKMEIKFLLVALVLCIISAFLAYPADAAENMTFHGTLREHPPCEINGGKPIDINFGEVGVNKINGQNYAEKFNISYECADEGADMVIRYLGIATGFDSAAVESNIADFGIRLSILSDDGVLTAFVVGSAIAVPSIQTSSTFLAIPVKKEGADLTGEAFTSSAMLQLEYP